MTKRVRAIAGVLVLGGLLMGLPLVRVQARGVSVWRTAAPPTALSPYWNAKIQQWTSLILQESERRGLDPDLVAALMWRESRGDATAIGPAGAVGLMQIMPKEAGFSWRPSRDELLVPFTNVYWGTRTLSTVIRQGRGDILSALAAYNGGWDKVDSRGPRAFATMILRDYAQSVAHRHAVEGHWVAFFAIADEGLRGPIWVADSAREDVYFYSDANATPEGTRLIPSVAPLALVAQFDDESEGCAFSVGVWVYHVEAQQWLAGNVVVPLGLSGVQPELMHAPVRVAAVSPAVMAGSVRPTPAVRPTAAAPLASSLAARAVAPTPDVSGTEAAPADAGMSAASVVTEMIPVEASAPDRGCAGGTLVVDAYPLDRINTPEGWMTHIYAQASGGNCSYTYAWNDEQNAQGVGLPGPIVFEVTSSRRDSALLGTVVVTSGEETVRVKLYIRPPD